MSTWMIVCSVCGKQVRAERENKTYCSRACQMKAFRKRKKLSRYKKWLLAGPETT